jgi:hypothetical protein
MAAELREIPRDRLEEILKKHVAWWKDAPGGERADLSYADLSYADLSCADLRSADLRFATLSYANLSCADLRFADLRSANLRSADLSSATLSYANLRFANLRFADLSSANLSSANLRFADLRSANVDYSAFPLWCGSFGVKVDIRLGAQLAYHFCRLETDDPVVKAAQTAIRDLANKFHLVGSCGEIT